MDIYTASYVDRHAEFSWLTSMENHETISDYEDRIDEFEAMPAILEAALPENCTEVIVAHDLSYFYLPDQSIADKLTPDEIALINQQALLLQPGETARFMVRDGDYMNQFAVHITRQPIPSHQQ